MPERHRHRARTFAARNWATIYELLGGPVRDEIALYTHPDQRKFTSKEGVVNEIRDIVKSGHTALKFDPFPYQGGPSTMRRRASSATAISTAACRAATKPRRQS